MDFYQHHFDRIEDYLHHRSPYLLIDEVVSLTDTSVVTAKTVRQDDFFVAGHFPGAPVVPGAVMQEMTTQSAGVLIASRYNPMPVYNTEDPDFNEFALGVLVKVGQARFRGFARSGDRLNIKVDLIERVGQLFSFAGAVEVDQRVVMRNQFSLANIDANQLKSP